MNNDSTRKPGQQNEQEPQKQREQNDPSRKQDQSSEKQW